MAPAGTAFDQLYIEIGRRLRAERESAGLTQSQLAAHLGLSRTSVSNIEAGRQRFPLHYVYATAVLLRCDLAKLLPSPTAKPYEEALRRLDVQEQRWIGAFLTAVEEKRLAAKTA